MFTSTNFQYHNSQQIVYVFIKEPVISYPRLNSYYSLKQPSFLCSSKGLYLTFIYFDTNRALKNSQFIVNSLKLLCWHSKHLTNVLQKHTYYTPLYGKIHLHFNIPIFQSSLIIISSVQEMDAALISLLCRTLVNFM